ncbi:MAG: ACT domain-containing protein [Clostridia bacterium]|nr:ACT domain-containing protein [Clostridia bacterium]MBR7160243.1 ACT domain-containing protein [Clostridia bacterium]
MKKAIVSVIGKDKKGIIARVCMELYNLNINIADITQTVMQEYFTMIMMVELEEDQVFAEVSSALKKLGEEIGVSISIQHEDIFGAMHRI